MAQRQQVGRGQGKPAQRFERDSRGERHHHVKAFRSRGHEPRGNVEFGEQAVDFGCPEPGTIEVPISRIEIEHQPIGMFEVILSKAWDVERDRVLVCQVKEAVEIRDGGVTDCPALLREIDALDERRKPLAGVLLHEPGLIDPARKSLQGERTPDHVRQHRPGCCQVISHHLAFGHTVSREEDLLRVRDFDQAVILPPLSLHAWSDTINGASDRHPCPPRSHRIRPQYVAHR